MQVITNLEHNILELKQERTERDETIDEKEKRILDLKRKNQELDKFKFVLEHNIEDLKKHVVAREAEVASSKDVVKVVSLTIPRQ